MESGQWSIGVSRNVIVFVPVFRVSPVFTIRNFHLDVSKNRSSPFFPRSVMWITAARASAMMCSMLVAWSFSI